jgi:hypothetical protein
VKHWCPTKNYKTLKREIKEWKDLPSSWINRINIVEIPRWWLEGGSRKRASYSEILERRWRHTLQA